MYRLLIFKINSRKIYLDGYINDDENINKYNIEIIIQFFKPNIKKK